MPESKTPTTLNQLLEALKKHPYRVDHVVARAEKYDTSDFERHRQAPNLRLSIR